MEKNKKELQWTDIKWLIAKVLQIETRNLAVGMFALGIFAIIFAFDMFILHPRENEKRQRMGSDLRILAKGIQLYKNENGDFPESLSHLNGFLSGFPETESMKIPIKDAWNQDYIYWKFYNNAAMIASPGRNGRMNTEFGMLTWPPKDKLRETGDKGIFELNGSEDDWIFLIRSLEHESSP